MDLTTAITKITADYDWDDVQTPDAVVAVMDARSSLTADEVRGWGIDHDIEQAYLIVLEADRFELADTLKASFA